MQEALAILEAEANITAQDEQLSLAQSTRLDKRNRPESETLFERLNILKLFLQGRSYDEISNVLGLKMGTVASSLSRAKESLVEIIEVLKTIQK